MIRRSALTAVVLLLGCRSEAPVEPPAPPPPSADAAVAPAPEPVDAGPISAPAPVEPSEPATANVTLTVNDRQRPLQWGYASSGFSGVSVTLTSWPSSCELREDGRGASLTFEVPAGPGRRFYAGHPIGVNVAVKASDQKMQFPVDMGPMGAVLGDGVTLMMGPAAVQVTVEPFEWKKGAHVRGTIDGSEAVLIGASGASGTFDAEVCFDADPAAKGLADSAPKTPVKAKTVHALVRRRPKSQDEAVDQSLKRSKGTYAEISRLVFYDKAKVPCGAAEPPGFLQVQSLGGADATRPLTTQQPATAVWREGNDAFAAVSEAWVQLDELAFDEGKTVRGSLWTLKKKGQPPFTGRFEAVVCAP